MPMYDCVRTVQVQQTSRRSFDAANFKVGDSVEVYYGRNEGHRFTIKAVRFNLDNDKFEYYSGDALGGCWYCDGQVVH